MSPVALVTGSGKKRIGWHVARALAQRGYAIVLHYFHSVTEAADGVQELRAGGAHAVALQADLTHETAVQGLIGGVLTEFGRLDVLVNCAGAWFRKRLEEVTARDVRYFFDTNTLSTFLCCQHAGLAMVKQPEGGAIVNLGDWAIERPYLDYPAYFPSKGAIPALTRSFAVELAARNRKVRVNCIQPGPVMLPPNLSPAERAESIRGTLLGHEGSPENVVQAVLFLIDNDFVTGTCLPVDGGRTIAG